MKFNPLYQFLTAARTIALDGKVPALSSLVLIGVIGLAMLLIGGTIFRKKQDKFIYYI